MVKCPHCDLPLEIQIYKSSVVAFERDANAAGGTSFGDRNINDVGSLLERIHDEDLEDGFEVKFVRETRERFARYKDRIRMSEKQMNILRRLAAK